VKSGQLTKQQGRALWHKDQRMNREAHAKAAKNGGLNQRQEARINRLDRPRHDLREQHWG
jgi:hypothetical protein